MRKLLIALAAIGVIGMVTPMTGPAAAGWKHGWKYHDWKYHHRHSWKRHDLRWQAPPARRFSWADIQALRAFTRMH